MSGKPPGKDLARWPAKGSGLGLRSILSETAGRAGLLARPPAFPPHDEVTQGAGQGVLVIPGFLTGDSMTARLRTFLKRSGYCAEGWRGGINLGPRSGPIERLKQRIEKIVDATGGPIVLAGVSLGGVFAREVAKMMPAQVAGVATLCSPVRLPVPTPLAPFVTALQGGFDAELVERALGEPNLPPQPLLAVYSRADGVVDWRTCVPPPGANVTAVELVDARHMTIASNPQAQAALAVFLARVFTSGHMDELPPR